MVLGHGCAPWWALFFGKGKKVGNQYSLENAEFQFLCVPKCKHWAHICAWQFSLAFFFITVNFFAFRRKWKFNISFSLASVSSYHVCFGFLMCIEAASKRVCLTVHVMWLGVIGGMLWSFPLNLCWFGNFFFPEVFYVLIL